MAPSTQMKRPASAPSAAEPQGKRRQSAGGDAKAKAAKQPEDPAVAKCNTVIELLGTAEGLSAASLRMLKVAIRQSLTVPKEERHEVQHAAVEMLSEVLRGIEDGHARRGDELKGKIAEADAEKARRDAAAEAATSAAKEKTDAVEAEKTALEEAKAATASAKAARTAAAAEQKAGDADLEKAGGRKALAEQVLSEDVTPLKDGTAADVGKSIRGVVKAGKELGFEAQLLSSAELVLGKAPADRGNFDVMVAQQISDDFGSAIARLAGELANGEAGKAARARKVEECAAQVEGAVANAEQSQRLLEEAKAALKDAEAARDAAEKFVEDLGPEMEQAATNAQAADIALYACKADLSVFDELVEGPKAAPPAAPEATDEAAQSADAADAELVEAPDADVP